MSFRLQKFREESVAEPAVKIAAVWDTQSMFGWWTFILVTIAITCRQGLNNEPYMKHLRGTVSVFKAKDVTI